MTGNKGEWSELYALFKLAADGRLYAADENTEKINTIYYDILKIIRKQKNDICIIFETEISEFCPRKPERK